MGLFSASLLFLTFLSLVLSERTIDVNTGVPSFETTRVFRSSRTRNLDAPELTDEFVVKVKEGVDPEALAADHGLRFEHCLKFSPQLCVFTQPPTQKREEHPNILKLRTHSHVHWVERQVLRRYAKFSNVEKQSENGMPDLSQNPLYEDQWHLHNTVARFQGQDVNVIPAWEKGYSGAGVLIGIVDDGLEHAHPDLSENYVAMYSWDFNGKDDDPTPEYKSDNHGTSVAGVAAAGNNGYCGVGSAFHANISGLRLISDPTSDKTTAEALTYSDMIDIYSNSWGYSTAFVGPLSSVYLEAFDYAMTEGRDGKGFIYSFAAGNDRQSLSNANYDPFSSAPETISVAAVDYRGIYSYYSNPGAALLISAPSNGNLLGITTTDRMGKVGYNAGDCDNEFGGTSSACPLISGCIALMLEANPQLGWRDVQHILAATARKNDPANPDWAYNGAKFHVNHNYGFGVVDASAAVDMSKTWTNLPQRETYKFTGTGGNIPDDASSPLMVSFQVDKNIVVEHVQVSVKLDHKRIDTLSIELQSPFGTMSRLLEFYAPTTQSSLKWDFLSVFNWGEFSQGKWQVIVTDGLNDRVTGQLKDIQLTIHGHTGGGSVAVHIDLKNYCSSQSFVVSWDKSIADVLQVSETDGSNPVTYSVTGKTSHTITNLKTGSYLLQLFQTTSSARVNLAYETFDLPNCNEPSVVVLVTSCNQTELFWNGGQSSSSIIFQNVLSGAVATAIAQSGKSGSKNVTLPYVGKWVAALTDNGNQGQQIARSEVFTGSLCSYPKITIMADDQCNGQKIVVRADNTQIGMTLNMGLRIDGAPVYSIVDTTTTYEPLILEFDRMEPYGKWGAVIGYGGFPIVGQSFTMSSCVDPSVSYDLGSNTCDNNGLGIVIASWTGAPDGSWVGIYQDGSRYFTDWVNADSESGTTVFQKLKPGRYQILLGDWDNNYLAETDFFDVSCEPLEQTPKPPKLKLKSVDTTEAVLKLKQKGDIEITYYQLRYSYDEKRWFELKEFEYTKVKITGLSKNTAYYFQARSLGGAWSDWGDTLLVQTPK